MAQENDLQGDLPKRCAFSTDKYLLISKTIVYSRVVILQSTECHLICLLCFIFILSFPQLEYKLHTRAGNFCAFWFTAIYCISKEQRLSVLELCPSEYPQMNAENLSRASSPPLLPGAVWSRGICVHKEQVPNGWGLWWGSPSHLPHFRGG